MSVRPTGADKYIVTMILLFLLFLSPAAAAAEDELKTLQKVPEAPIIFVVLSQEESHHRQIADSTVRSILRQWGQLVPERVMSRPRIVTTHDLRVS